MVDKTSVCQSVVFDVLVLNLTAFAPFGHRPILPNSKKLFIHPGHTYISTGMTIFVQNALAYQAQKALRRCGLCSDLAA
ncbi:MAG: hypothetical protein LUH36_09645, partial [Oscillospiraceae bacterium]|nr:hypothetical protein [Oscillospiraceae bacterium]